jgi:hypothetical protein
MHVSRDQPFQVCRSPGIDAVDAMAGISPAIPSKLGSNYLGSHIMRFAISSHSVTHNDSPGFRPRPKRRSPLPHRALGQLQGESPVAITFAALRDGSFE